MKDAYRRVALKHHPDMNHQGLKEKEKARKLFEKDTCQGRAAEGPEGIVNRSSQSLREITTATTATVYFGICMHKQSNLGGVHPQKGLRRF